MRRHAVAAACMHAHAVARPFATAHSRRSRLSGSQHAFAGPAAAFTLLQAAAAARAWRGGSPPPAKPRLPRLARARAACGRVPVLYRVTGCLPWKMCGNAQPATPRARPPPITLHPAFAGLLGRCSITVSISACHAGDPGSIPGSGAKGARPFCAWGSPGLRFPAAAQFSTPSGAAGRPTGGLLGGLPWIPGSGGLGRGW